MTLLLNRGVDRRERRGLTLMELVVVMAVLTALAAILIPMFPNLLCRAHKATDATQTNETSKALQLYQASFVSYPDGYDLLTDGTDFPEFLPWDGLHDATPSTAPFGGFVTSGALTADEVAALRRVGIEHVSKLGTGATDFHPTMNPYSEATAVTIDTTLNFALLDTAATSTARSNMTLKNAMEADPSARFIVMGVGPRCSMIGQTIQDAPTSVPQDKGFTPANTYSRIGVVFKVSGTEVGRTERARFICAAAMEDDELESTEKDTVTYYDVAAGTH